MYSTKQKIFKKCPRLHGLVTKCRQHLKQKLKYYCNEQWKTYLSCASYIYISYHGRVIFIEHMNVRLHMIPSLSACQNTTPLQKCIQLAGLISKINKSRSFFKHTEHYNQGRIRTQLLWFNISGINNSRLITSLIHTMSLTLKSFRSWELTRSSSCNTHNVIFNFLFDDTFAVFHFVLAGVWRIQPVHNKLRPRTYVCHFWPKLWPHRCLHSGFCLKTQAGFISPCYSLLFLGLMSVALQIPVLIIRT